MSSQKNHGSVSLTPHLVNSNDFTFDTLKAAALTKENQGGQSTEKWAHLTLFVLQEGILLCGGFTEMYFSDF